MVSEHARILGVSETTAQWRLVAASVVLFVIGGCVVVSYLPSSLFQSRVATDETNSHESAMHAELKSPPWGHFEK